MYFRMNLKMEKPMLCCCFTWIVFIELNFTVAFMLIRKTWDDQFTGKVEGWGILRNGGILVMGLGEWFWYGVRVHTPLRTMQWWTWLGWFVSKIVYYDDIWRLLLSLTWMIVFVCLFIVFCLHFWILRIDERILEIHLCISYEHNTSISGVVFFGNSALN